MHYQLFCSNTQPKFGHVSGATVDIFQTVGVLLGVHMLAQVQTVASENTFAIFAVANAKDYALPNPSGSLAAAQVSGDKTMGHLFGPVLIVYRDE